ncbi:hypothetical protein Q7C36_010995 [Tachysurus vachellii]|uniref:Uncharacterized protein n=1 Tax=Tachysurus vachellii TaxID=175792 RepID=A0AA88MVK3_TACVA|nr:hypothetical protein Q7C36_010995 [Tachysurus vachellii]
MPQRTLDGTERLMELERRAFCRVASRPFTPWQPLINRVTVWTAGRITEPLPEEQERKSRPCPSGLIRSPPPIRHV